MAVPIVDTETTWRDVAPPLASAIAPPAGTEVGAEVATALQVLVVLPTTTRSRTSTKCCAGPVARCRRDGPRGRRRQPRWHRRAGRGARSHVSAASRCVRRAGKQGLGSAYRVGFRDGLAREYDVMVEMDADMSHDPAVLPELLRAVADGADLVIGSRYVPGGSIPEWPLLRRAISRIGVPVRAHDAASTDSATRPPDSGPTVVRRLPRSTSTTVRADGYGFQVEMAYRVHKMGGRIAEVPIEFRDRTLGRSKMSMRIVVEALWLVTRWGIRDRMRPTRRTA